MRYFQFLLPGGYLHPAAGTGKDTYPMKNNPYAEIGFFCASILWKMERCNVNNVKLKACGRDAISQGTIKLDTECHWMDKNPNRCIYLMYILSHSFEMLLLWKKKLSINAQSACLEICIFILCNYLETNLKVNSN